MQQTLLQEVEQLGEGLLGAEREAHAFKREFDKLDKGNGVVEIRDVPRIIEGVLGREVWPWIKDRILKMFDSNRNSKVSWPALQEGLRMAGKSFKVDVSLKSKTVPEWHAIECEVNNPPKYSFNNCPLVTITSLHKGRSFSSKEHSRPPRASLRLANIPCSFSGSFS